MPGLAFQVNTLKNDNVILDLSRSGFSQIPNWFYQVPRMLLSPTQKEVLEWYASHAENFTPYQVKIAAQLGFHRKTIHRTVAKLSRLGLLEIDKAKSSEHRIYRFVGWDKAKLLLSRLFESFKRNIDAAVGHVGFRPLGHGGGTKKTKGRIPIPNKIGEATPKGHSENPKPEASKAGQSQGIKHTYSSLRDRLDALICNTANGYHGGVRRKSGNTFLGRIFRKGSRHTHKFLAWLEDDSRGTHRRIILRSKDEELLVNLEYVYTAFKHCRK